MFTRWYQATGSIQRNFREGSRPQILCSSQSSGEGDGVILEWLEGGIPDGVEAVPCVDGGVVQEPLVIIPDVFAVERGEEGENCENEK